MSAPQTGLAAHLASGATHLCHAWALTRADGHRLGFTDHDRALMFDGLRFAPETGLSARAIASTTGLSVNNTEALGLLSAAAITERDIQAGLYDGAQIALWLVRWDDVAQRALRFAGQLGEITRKDGGFTAELRGLTEALNQPQGRSYLAQCSAVLGDARCRMALDDPLYRAPGQPVTALAGHLLGFAGLGAFHPRWFEGGQISVTSGAAAGLAAVIKSDTALPDGRRTIALWDPLPLPVALGDLVTLTAGCDKRSATCRGKFANLVNFQGFPDIPGDDWLMAVPRSDGDLSGRSRRNP